MVYWLGAIDFNILNCPDRAPAVVQQKHGNLQRTMDPSPPELALLPSKPRNGERNRHGPASAVQ